MTGTCLGGVVIGRQVCQMEHPYQTPQIATPTAPTWALLIDGDNVSPDSFAQIRAQIRSRGHVPIRRVYGNGTQRPKWREQAGLRFMEAGAGKNAADMLLCIEAVEMLLTGTVSGLILVTHDRDFSHLLIFAREKGFPVELITTSAVCEKLHAAAARHTVSLLPAGVKAQPIKTGPAKPTPVQPGPDKTGPASAQAHAPGPQNASVKPGNKTPPEAVSPPHPLPISVALSHLLHQLLPNVGDTMDWSNLNAEMRRRNPAFKIAENGGTWRKALTALAGAYTREGEGQTAKLRRLR